jgi:uncharacterized protein YndB with AHSA1/START domain
MKNTCSIEIEAPIQRVFDYLHDPRKQTLWLKGLEATEYPPDYDPDHPLGASFTQKINEGRHVQVYDGRITAFERPKHLGVRLSSSAVTAVVDYRLTRLKIVTRVDFSSELTFKSIAFRTMATLSRPLLRGILEEQLRRLKAVVEAGR